MTGGQGRQEGVTVEVRVGLWILALDARTSRSTMTCGVQARLQMDGASAPLARLNLLECRSDLFKPPRMLPKLSCQEPSHCERHFPPTIAVVLECAGCDGLPPWRSLM